MPLIAERSYSPESEKALARLWQRADSLPDGLVTQDGRHFRVLYPGRPNSRSGPDFHDAVLATDSGEILTGDVELHLNAPDWYSHRHHTDPNYNGVILHIVLSTKGHSLTNQHSKIQVPVASLETVVDELSNDIEPPGLLFAEFADATKSEKTRRLDAAGDERFLAKSRGFALEMAESSPNQVLYSALMEALGYASNRRPFRELAKRVPISDLESLRGEPATTRKIAINAMLIGVSGLTSYFGDSQEQAQLKRLFRKLTSVSAMSLLDWNLFRVRPTNHPARRILGAAEILDRHIETGLVKGMVGELAKSGIKRLTESLMVRPYIGTSRAEDATINVVLPFLYAYAGIQHSSESKRLCMESYWSHARLSDNEVTREMKRQLGLSNADVTGARQQQGLIHLYKTVVKIPTALAHREGL